MSAQIVPKEGIDTLVTALIDRGVVDPVQADEIGRVLWAENLASVAYRYPEDVDGHRPGAPGFRDGDVAAYTHVHEAVGLDRQRVVNRLDFYVYQSCEHPGWSASRASALVDALRSALG